METDRPPPPDDAQPDFAAAMRVIVAACDEVIVLRARVTELERALARYEAAEALATGTLHFDRSGDDPAVYIHDVPPNTPR